tara:strand:- start:108 stop:245 length:138 start_codon:yes stop_codon:yes gene_type:complete
MVVAVTLKISIISILTVKRVVGLRVRDLVRDIERGSITVSKEITN